MKSIAIKVCIFSFFYSSLYSAQHNNGWRPNASNPAQQSNHMVMQQANQSFVASNNQRTIDNCVASGQRISPDLINQMHPGAAIAAYQHNINVAGGKK